MFFIKYVVVIYVAMCYQSFISDAWVHAYISVQNICTLIRLAGKANLAGGKERALRAKVCTSFRFKIHLFFSKRFTKFSTVYF